MAGDLIISEAKLFTVETVSASPDGVKRFSIVATDLMAAVETLALYWAEKWGGPVPACASVLLSNGAVISVCEGE